MSEIRTTQKNGGWRRDELDWGSTSWGTTTGASDKPIECVEDNWSEGGGGDGCIADVEAQGKSAKVEEVVQGNQGGEQRQGEEGSGLQKVKRGDCQNIFQEGGSSLGDGVDTGGGFCINVGSQKCLSSCQGREESERKHEFQFRQQEFHERRNAFWVDKEPCDFLQCAEAGDQRNQRKVESESNFLYKRYSAYLLGQRKAWKVDFGSDEVLGGFGMVAGSRQMLDKSEKEIRVSGLRMKFRKKGGLHSEAEIRITEKVHYELDGIDEEMEKDQSKNECSNLRGIELFEDQIH
ncbi:MAG: hypothetical protein EZS28_022897 [Streblomastix strix]|uniref:Uncharacterized protein n=1 Tax=Streblomastix strix TaxID=222440 RepID=A0A5J4VG64_9EUKA|nr:MAG: hypothetical protein EZS28_022897 [Streblomastix strix]